VYEHGGKPLQVITLSEEEKRRRVQKERVIMATNLLFLKQGTRGS